MVSSADSAKNGKTESCGVNQIDKWMIIIYSRASGRKTLIVIQKFEGDGYLAADGVEDVDDPGARWLAGCYGERERGGSHVTLNATCTKVRSTWQHPPASGS